MVIAVLGIASAGIKVAALRRGFSLSVLVITSSLITGVSAFFVQAPVVYRTLDGAAGRIGFASLIVYSCIVLYGAHGHMLAVVWAAEVGHTPVPRVRIVVHLVSYAVILAAMWAAFWRTRGGGPERPLAFNVSHADDPDTVVFLVVFMAGLSYSMLSAAWECRRGARTDNPRLRRGLRHISVASLFIFGYVVFAGPSLACAAAGHHQLDVLTDVGSLSGTVGAVILNWGMSGSTVQTWWRDRRDYRRLRVLWETAVGGAERTVALAPPGRLVERWSLLSAGAWLLLRRLADICDAERALSPWMNPRLAVVAEEAGRRRRLPPEEVRALASAAMLLDAVERKGRGEPPGYRATPRPADVAPERERAHLVRVARALGHPLVREVLAERRNETGPAVQS
nr:MAB_1171c family putative transporter [Streptomyces sp. SID5468]